MAENDRAMVDRLAARLRQDGSDVDGWIQLVRSYLVLNETENARAAIADARSPASPTSFAASMKKQNALE